MAEGDLVQIGLHATEALSKQRIETNREVQ